VTPFGQVDQPCFEQFVGAAVVLLEFPGQAVVDQCWKRRMVSV
jgi:hypothetical protein